MRIAMLTNKITIGGGLEYIYQIARHLSNDQFIILGKGGDDITLLDKLPNVTVVKSGYFHKIIKKYNVDIIHVNHLRPLLRLLINPFNMPKVPVINTVHGLHVRKYNLYRMKYGFYGKTENSR